MIEMPEPLWNVLRKHLRRSGWSDRDYVGLKAKYADYRAAADELHESYKRLRVFQVQMYLDLLSVLSNGAGGYLYPRDRDFDAKRQEIGEQLERLTQEIVDSIVAHCVARRAYSFEQGVLLKKAGIAGIESSGVCNALALDWLRRKNWNADLASPKQKKMYNRSPEGSVALISKAAELQKISKRPEKIDELETKLQQLSLKGENPDELETKIQELRREGKNPQELETKLQQLRRKRENPKGFLALHKLHQERIGFEDDHVLTEVFDQRLNDPRLQHYPRCIYLDLSRLARGALQGHAAALFHATPASFFDFFDPNHGEYNVDPTTVAEFVARWFELYRPFGMSFEPIFFVGQALEQPVA